MNRHERIVKRRKKDKALKSLIYAISSFAIIILAAIILYVLFTGSHLVKWETIVGDAIPINTDIYLEDSPAYYENNYEGKDQVFYSEEWGIGFIDTYSKEGHEMVVIEYVHEDSPFKLSLDKNNDDDLGNPEFIELDEGITFLKAFLITSDDKLVILLETNSAEEVASAFSEAISIQSVSIQKAGGGIRGSIITTLYLIGLTMILALPIGVSTAIYFNEYAKKTKFSGIVRYLVDLLTGVPSIIYGLLGAAVFIPVANKVFNTSGGSIIAGALTLSVVILPVIIKSTEEALKVIPNDIRNASFALGASHTQTVFKVVLPSATPGILTGVMLSIGRVIGESAALIFVMGVSIKDVIKIDQKSTSLAVHIWSIMGGEEPNYQLASAIAIIILGIVFVMNMIVKLIGKKMNKAWY